MNLDLTEDQIDIRDAVRALCAGEFAEHAAAWDQADDIPHWAIDKLAEMGLLGITLPEKYGGLGHDVRTSSMVVTEIAKVSASLAILFAVHNSVGAYPIAVFGTDEQKQRYLPRLASRDMGAFSLSEPGSGSDAASLSTTAVLDGDDYVLNGSKNWVTNGVHAWTFLVFARTGGAGAKGISAFILERDMPGLVVGKCEDKMGLRGSHTVTLSLENLRVPASQRLGGEGEGFGIALSSLDKGRIGVAAQALGVMEAAFAEAVKYAQQRSAFGSPIAKIQAVQFKLAEMEKRIHGARLLIQRAAWMKDTDQPCTRQAAEAKLYATEAATYVTHQAIQVHGGYGYVKEYAVERYYRDVRVMEIYEGTSEIQRLVIARSMLKDGVKV
ncbi:MAG: acyl-CoA dehydrogenase family protein [Candidatus Eisenbacteria bacterium]